jgi:hypothetical protein
VPRHDAGTAFRIDRGLGAATIEGAYGTGVIDELPRLAGIAVD